MIGRRAVVGLSLLSALLFCAFAAQSASAVPAKNTTLVTCVKAKVAKTGDFDDEHCDKENKEKKGEWTHESISNAIKNTLLEFTNTKTIEGGKDVKVNAVFKSKAFGVEALIECEEAQGTGEATNEEPTAKEHRFTIANIEVKFTKCKVAKPAGCKVKEPIVAKATAEGKEGLEGPKKEKNAMGIEIKGSGAEETIAEVTFEKGFGACEGTFKLKGNAIATGGPGQEENNAFKFHGATWILNSKANMESLTFGAESAELTATLTPRMTDPVKLTTENPITATTTT